MFLSLGTIKGKSKPLNPYLPPVVNINLSLIKGVDMVNLLETSPIPPSNLNLSM